LFFFNFHQLELFSWNFFQVVMIMMIHSYMEINEKLNFLTRLLVKSKGSAKLTQSILVKYNTLGVIYKRFFSLWFKFLQIAYIGSRYISLFFTLPIYPHLIPERNWSVSSGFKCQYIGTSAKTCALWFLHIRSLMDNSDQDLSFCL